MSVNGEAGTLVADVKYNDRRGAGSSEEQGVSIATLSNVGWPEEAVDGEQIQLTADVTFTEAGAAVIGYGADQLDSDPLTLDFTAENVPAEVIPEPAPEPGADQALQLQWGIHDSFRGYITSPIAHGSIETTCTVGANPAFTWANGTGTAGDRDLAWEGGVHFTGHASADEAGEFILDLNVTNPRIDAVDGILYADVVSRKFVDTTTLGDRFEETNVPFAQLVNGSWNGGAYTAQAVLTEEGAIAFGGFYDAGTELAPVIVQLAATLTACDDTNAPPATGGSGGDDEGETPGGSTETEQEVCIARATTGTLDWGVKESFRTYISSGIAKGGWTLSGIQETGSGFRWSGSGPLNTDAMLGQVSMPGTLHFSGHDGALDTKITNLTLVIHSASQASIYADVASVGFQLDAFSQKGVRLANVNIQGATLTNGAFSVAGASTTLTTNGARALDGHYEAGAALDPISFSLSLGAEVECSDAVNPHGAGASLARTGLETPAFALIVFAALLMAAGARVVAASRRRA